MITAAAAAAVVDEICLESISECFLTINQLTRVHIDITLEKYEWQIIAPWGVQVQ